MPIKIIGKNLINSEIEIISNNGKLVTLRSEGSRFSLACLPKEDFPIIEKDNLAKFVEIIILEDSEEGLWVTGIPEQVEIIIQGQGFVEDGQEVITNRI